MVHQVDKSNHKKHFPVVSTVKKQITIYNTALRKLIPEKNKDFVKIPQIHVYYVMI